MVLPTSFPCAQLNASQVVHNQMAHIEHLYLDEETANVFFVSENGEDRVPAHKEILSMQSDVFNQMFYGEGQSDTYIPIENPDVFEEFLKVLYKPRMSLHVTTVDIVMKFAQKYKVRKCFRVCVSYLAALVSIMEQICAELSVIDDKANFVEQFDYYWDKLGMSERFTDVLFITLEIATEFKCVGLIVKCERFIETYGCDVVAGLPYSMYVSKKDLSRFLLVDFADRNEFDVFVACLKLAQNKFGCVRDTELLAYVDLKETLGSCVELIRFGAMNRMQFDYISKTFPQTFSDDEIQKIFGEIAANEEANEGTNTTSSPTLVDIQNAIFD